MLLIIRKKDGNDFMNSQIITLYNTRGLLSSDAVKIATHSLNKILFIF